MTRLQPRHDWPPLVGARHLPKVIRLRDTLLTAGAWLLLGYLLRDFFALAWDYLSNPIFELSFTTPPDWQEIWQRLKPYTVYAGILVAWLLYWGYTLRHHLADASHKPQPPHLPPEEHALGFNLPAAHVRECQTKRSLVVSFDAQGNITSIKDHLDDRHFSPKAR